ncbi:N-6 DNA methylase [Amycolatopsis sp. TNS106]|uniref:N-6 DNA methylase n=1 Tax=Amycolatopsis sp. TNS106 TaxID=2861750 RepID=UPI001C586A51|nr:N-6 DNA methylase [Amycolatopsis sp. TNS106]
MRSIIEANTAGGERRTTQVFQDFCALAAFEIRAAVDRASADRCRDHYLTIADGYTTAEIEHFGQALTHLVQELDRKLSDVLGELYMTLELGNQRVGQYFTPYDASLLSASVIVADMTRTLDELDFVTVYEPTCGAGGMIIATADLLGRSDVNYQKAIHVTARDLELTAVHMTYIQLTLLHIPALVIHGDTLTLDQFDVWPTPAHVLDGWNRRLCSRG